MAYPTELRRRVFDAYSKSSVPVEQIARQYGVSRSTIYNWRSRRQQTDSLERSAARGGRRPKLDAQVLGQLRALVHASPEPTLRRLCAELERTLGVRVHRSTVSRALRRLRLSLSGEATSAGSESESKPAESSLEI